MTVLPLPATPTAVERGCVCPVSTNDNGRGVMNPDTGRRYWVVDGDCPLHGYGATASDDEEE